MLFYLCTLVYFLFTSLSFFLLVRAVWRLEQLHRKDSADEE